MKHKFIICLVTILLSAVQCSYAQNKPDNVCYVNNGRIYFQLDKRWSDTKKKEISALFSLDSLLIEKAFEGKSPFVKDSITWEVTFISVNIVELSKAIPKSEASYNPGDIMLIDDNWMIKPIMAVPVFAPDQKYGLNKFAKDPTITFEDGLAHFYLHGNQKAETVYLSGSFNNWSTSELPMQKTGTGWEASVKINPGKCLYKYIIDGKWKQDMNSLLHENDENGGLNSVVYSYNYVFKLNGYLNSKKVYVSGSFNNWNKKDLKMNQVPGGWSLPIYLADGTYSYKFLADGTWIPDPANTNTRADADGNMNSFIGIGDTMIFKLIGYAKANKVILSGSFNNWNHTELVMNKTADGWELPYVMGGGSYEYKFIVDGKWMPDPANPVTTGQGEYTNSCLVFKPNFTFTLNQFADAKNVIVTGSFNGWNEDSYKMIQKDGAWTYQVFLKPGKYTYKFIVDGKWLIDPANDVWEDNTVGTGNSVLWIEP
jgi:hypothetical protein